MAKKKKPAAKDVFAGLLSPSELNIWHDIDTSAASQLDTDIRLLTIRERRILERIQKLEAGVFTITKIQEDTTTTGKNTLSRQAVTSEANFQLIKEAEETLTRIQTTKARLIESKMRIESIAKEEERPDISTILGAINGSVSEVWDDVDE